MGAGSGTPFGARKTILGWMSSLYSRSQLLMGRLISWSGGDTAYPSSGSFYPNLIDLRWPGECLGSHPNNELCRPIGFGSSKSIKVVAGWNAVQPARNNRGAVWDINGDSSSTQPPLIVVEYMNWVIWRAGSAYGTWLCWNFLPRRRSNRWGPRLKAHR